MTPPLSPSRNLACVARRPKPSCCSGVERSVGVLLGGRQRKVPPGRMFLRGRVRFDGGSAEGAQGAAVSHGHEAHLAHRVAAGL
jgi:hypothetical protein